MLKFGRSLRGNYYVVICTSEPSLPRGSAYLSVSFSRLLCFSETVAGCAAMHPSISLQRSQSTVSTLPHVQRRTNDRISPTSSATNPGGNTSGPLPRLFSAKRRSIPITHAAIRNLDRQETYASTESTHSTKCVPRKLAVEDAISTVQMVPMPMCVINLDGKVLSLNSTFSTTFTGSPLLNLLEVVCPNDVDRFYTQLLSIASGEGHIEEVQVSDCLSKMRTSVKEIVLAHYDWTLSRHGGSADFLVVTATRSISAEKSSCDWSPIASDRKKPPMCSNRERHTLSPSTTKHLKTLLTDEDEPLQQPLLRHQWDSFLSKVEVKTKKFIEYKHEQMRSQALLSTIETKRVFVRHVSHEIRTPLNIAIAGMALLEDYRETFSADANEIVGEIHCAISIAIDILNDLLTYDKLDSKNLVLDRTVFDINLLVRCTLDLFKVQARSANVQMVLEDSKWSTLCVNADYNKLIQVLRNLMSNALKFTPSGGTVTIRVSVAEDTRIVRVDVEDTGPGISPQGRKLLFHEGDEFDPEELQNSQGSGLGLFLSRKIIELHSGSIGVDMVREQVQGSAFFFALPLSEDVIEAPVAGRMLSNYYSLMPLAYNYCTYVALQVLSLSGDNSPRLSMTSLSKARLLIVDDVPLCRKLHYRMLRPSVEECVEACDGKVAVDKVRLSMEENRPFDAILMDSSMPHMNGTTATKLIRELGYKGRIIGITGNCLPADIADFLAHGVDEVIIKPLKPEAFASILDSIAKHYQGTTTVSSADGDFTPPMDTADSTLS